MEAINWSLCCWHLRCCQFIISVRRNEILLQYHFCSVLFCYTAAYRREIVHKQFIIFVLNKLSVDILLVSLCSSGNDCLNVKTIYFPVLIFYGCFFLLPYSYWINRSSSVNFEQMTQFDASHSAENDWGYCVEQREFCFVFIDSTVHPHFPSSAFVMMYFPKRKLSQVLTPLELDSWSFQIFAARVLNSNKSKLEHCRLIDMRSPGFTLRWSHVFLVIGPEWDLAFFKLNGGGGGGYNRWGTRGSAIEF